MDGGPSHERIGKNRGRNSKDAGTEQHGFQQRPAFLEDVHDGHARWVDMGMVMPIQNPIADFVFHQKHERHDWEKKKMNVQTDQTGNFVGTAKEGKQERGDCLKWWNGEKADEES